MGGSSPRVRGKAQKQITPANLSGIIPAGAGKSFVEVNFDRLRSDHPRGCGEKLRAAPRGRGNAGSSPRVRGKEQTLRNEALNLGIIPAGAGKRLSGASVPTARQDHPRGCGEKAGSPRGPCGLWGSSPRVRGKAQRIAPTAKRRGIIPAGAGKSSLPNGAAKQCQDHPRGCGEKSALPLATCARTGSSPRVRGKGAVEGELRAQAGIIPAGAGKRACGLLPWAVARDHPRGCGEKDNAAAKAIYQAGSSPRVRGKASSQIALASSAGIIPAGAGKSHGVAWVGRLGGDHPRGCGEKPRQRPRPARR